MYPIKSGAALAAPAAPAFPDQYDAIFVHVLCINKQGRIQDFVLGGAYRDGNGGVPRPPNLPGCLGKRSKHHHLRPKTLATVFFFFALWKL